ncbi:DNA polymerase/3'-5' exonuclease PolX [Granulicella tundricola]|uniref:DNA polymerase beta n=1 Tax=Granulicella tundricola (strain ATCC BAA-1859 / DSM 23138 / MP5ACTX9) TaxID=1198114 RepID=E8WWL1_GRATM|nr:DNA polymerase/3'-5' exonuclease PolX [Granulicella tundricola]ADW69675.1 PHP domain protein [Granulicella tundricola MP5ACTX9]
MDNISLARLLDETASLLEIDGADIFRIRSYRRAAEAVEQQTTQLATLATPEADPKALLAIAGIGKAMAANIRDLVATGSMPLREELLQKYRPTMLELLRLPGMGPKTVALVWSALQVSNIDELEAAAKAGHLAALPRMGEKFTVKLLKGIEDHRKNSSRFRIDQARDYAEKISQLILAFPGIDQVTPAGSLRRGRETVGDLDLLATGPACEPDVVASAVEHVATLPLIDKLMARGQNKVTFTLRNNLQVDVRLLPRSSYGAALQYFTGSKHHNVALRQRAIKRGMTLSEYALLRLEDNKIIASESEEAIYNALDLDFIPPELRENCGELEAAANHTLPQLITLADLHGDVHMHTSETDGTYTIREMAEAAILRGRRYIAITDHSKNLAMTNGMNDERALAHAARVRQVNQEMEGRIHIFTGIECDILGEGEMDLTDETLAQLDIVIASVHSKFDQPIEVMTARVLRAIENPYVRILAHPTGRKLLRRDPYKIDLEQIFRRASELGVAVEHNAAPARTDLSDSHMRLAKSLGCKIVVNTDAHATDELDHMQHGIVQLRRAWLTSADVINTAPTPEDFLASLRPRP